MARNIFTLIVFMGLVPAAALAQNYVPAQNYNNPDVIVNMDVISGGGAPVHLRPPLPRVQNLPPLTPPRPLTPPPAARMPQQQAYNPPSTQQPAPLPMQQPMQQPAYQPPSASAPTMAPPMAPPMAIAPELSTRALAQQAAANDPVAPVNNDIETPRMDDLPPPPAAALAAPSPVMPPPAVALPETRPAPAVADTTKPARELLAQAREDAKSGASGRTPVALNETKPDVLPAPPASALMRDVPQNITADTAPNAKTDDGFEAYRVLFTAGDGTIAAPEKAVLDKIVTLLKAEPAARLSLRAYANGTPETESQARRLSLTRAMAVRNYLMDQGVLATRLDVRALGMGSRDMNDQVGTSKQPPDRVDMLIVR